MSTRDPRIEQLLQSFRGRLRGHVVTRGAAVLGLAAIAAAVVSFGLDFWLRLDVVSRLVTSAVLFGGLAYVFHRMLYGPLAIPLADDDVALMVEKRFPQLGETVVSAIQFERRLDAKDESVQLMEDVRRRAADAAGAVRLGEAFRTGAVAKLALASLAVLGLAAVVVAKNPGTSALWFQRNVLFGSAEWPRRTHVTVRGFENGVVRVPRGEAQEIVVEVTGEIPNRVEIDFRFASGEKGAGVLSELPPSEDEAAAAAAAGTVAPHLYRFELVEIVEDVRFEVTGGDGSSGELRIEVAERPTIERMEFELRYPPYLHLQPETRDAGDGEIEVPAGTEVGVVAFARKDLEAAEMSLGRVAIPVRLVSPRRLEAAFEPSRSGLLELSLVDTEGLRSEPPVRVHVRRVDDRAPRVTVRLEGIGSEITPDAMVPIEYRIVDDHGLQEVVLSRRVVAGRGSTSDTPDTGDLRGRFPGLDLGPADREVSGTAIWEVEELRLTPGDTLRFHVAARDDDALAKATDGSTEAGKWGESEPFVLRVVSQEDLFAEMIRRQQEVRRDLERLIEQVEADRDDFAPLGGVLTGELDAETARLLASLARQQRRSGRRGEELAARFERILAEMRNNRLLSDAEALVISKNVSRPLRRLSESDFPPSADRIEDVKNGETPTARTEAHAVAVDRYDFLLGRLRTILEAMRKAEGYTELIDRLKRVIRRQDEVRGETERERRERAESFFDDEGKSGGGGDEEGDDK